MTKGKYEFVGGKFIPKVEKPLEVKSHTIIPDEIPATLHPANRKYYTSRTEFDKVTKQFGYENMTAEEHDRMEPVRPDYDDEIIEDLFKAEAAVDYGEALTYEQRDILQRQEEAREWRTNNK
jgi:hypothetical protein